MLEITKNLISLFLTLAGYVYFLFFKRTPQLIYQSYVKSYCFTNGRISHFLNFFNKYFITDNFSYNKNIIFKDLNFDEINNKLKKNGYYVFENKIDEDTLKKIINFSYNTKCYYYNDKGTKKFTTFNPYLKPEEYQSAKYSFNETDLFNFNPIKKIIFNNKFITIAYKYFNSKPFLSDVAMWWSPTRNLKPTNETEQANQSAQKFHFDLDRIKWLKLFIYLSDTHEDSGPHEYVQGSHKISAKPKSILKNGYTRIDESIIENNFPKDKIIKILGSKGTMFIADTSCFHRGLPPISEHRLILIIEYASSMFGAEFGKIKKLNENKIDENLIIKNKIID